MEFSLRDISSFHVRVIEDLLGFFLYSDNVFVGLCWNVNCDKTSKLCWIYIFGLKESTTVHIEIVYARVTNIKRFFGEIRRGK